MQADQGRPRGRGRLARGRQPGTYRTRPRPPTVVGVSGDDHRFRVLAWVSERRFVLYVPEIEAATTVPAMPDADAAARSLIADLTGIPESAIRCDIEVGRVPGGPPSLR